MSETRTAEYDSTCMGCGRPVHAGEPIDTHQGSWMHALCAHRAKHPAPICPRCYMQQPCDCEE